MAQQQQTSPLRILLLAGGGIGLIAVVFFWVVRPMMQKDQKIKSLKRQVEAKFAELQKINEERKKFQDYEFRSLPKQKALAKAGYDRYLQGLFARNGIHPANTTIDPGQPKSTTIRLANVSGRPMEVYTAYPYQIKIKSTNYENVIKLLTDFDRAPVLHRVNSVKLEPTDKKGRDADEVSVYLELEAVVVDPKDKQAKTGVFVYYHTLMAGVGVGFVPWGGLDNKRIGPKTQRDYMDIARLNIFYGGTEEPPPPSPEKKNEKPEDKGPPPPPPPRDYSEELKFVKLEQIDNFEDGQTLRAGFRNWNVSSKPITFKAKDKFAFKSPEGDVMLSGTIVKVEDRDVVFTAKGNVYKIHNGSSLYEAMTGEVGTAVIQGSGMENEFFRMSLYGLPGG